MAKSNTSNMSDADAKQAPLRPPRSRAAPARAPRIADDLVSMLPDVPIPDEAGLEPPVRGRAAIGMPDRKYSFNALVAVGIAGFLVGRLLSR
ncbi:hypothetical protein KHC28_21770 [Ancylobacter sonchi]|uniref:hypothetical protein n=1 Tax=Ancylobacter sonchi TaxID=1937790 RepID=UPI001BD5F123|nr:hypothetical protein [Ancylobacter sonchi]MBS7536283.1 hypothetical protein [Ancylobacter sonchi]